MKSEGVPKLADPPFEPVCDQSRVAVQGRFARLPAAGGATHGFSACRARRRARRAGDVHAAAVVALSAAGASLDASAALVVRKAPDETPTKHRFSPSVFNPCFIGGVSSLMRCEPRSCGNSGQCNDPASKILESAARSGFQLREQVKTVCRWRFASGHCQVRQPAASFFLWQAFGAMARYSGRNSIPTYCRSCFGKRRQPCPSRRTGRERNRRPCFPPEYMARSMPEETWRSGLQETVVCLQTTHSGDSAAPCRCSP